MLCFIVVVAGCCCGVVVVVALVVTVVMLMNMVVLDVVVCHYVNHVSQHLRKPCQWYDICRISN